MHNVLLLILCTTVLLHGTTWYYVPMLCTYVCTYAMYYILLLHVVVEEYVVDEMCN